ncbi:MAG: hypothetical protein FJ298_11490 [Planctomycetes bacterium]|nr:hypothetical protein [Planctomycetota bacterium]
MLSLLLAASALCTAAPSLDLALCVGPRSLRAQNTSAAPELVVLHDPRTGYEARFIVPPQRTLDLRFPAGTIDGFELRVLTRDLRGPRVGGSWSLDVLRSAGDSVGFDLSEHPYHAWAFGARGTSLLTSDEFPTSGSPAALCTPPPPPHVPVITPHDGVRKDLPPRLENKPLPPI